MTTTKKIQKALIANPELDRQVLAEKFNVSRSTVGANYTILIRQGKIIRKVEEKIKSVADVYQLAKEKKDNSYTNHNGANKEIARVKMANYVTDSGVIGCIPTLPNTDWVIEQKIAKVLPEVDFIGAECEPNTFDTMKLNLKKLTLNAKTHFGKIGELIYGKIENTYAHLILDYCGMLPTFSKEIEYAINNDVIKVGGIIAITFGKPLRGSDNQSEKIKGLAPINNEDTRCMSDRAVESYFAKITGWNYEVKEIFYYTDKKDKGKGYPMILAIIKRIK
jgi:hypothetical protein